jgi:hypothetical protein
MTPETGSFTAEIDAALDRRDAAGLAQEYWAQDEFLFINGFLPPAASEVLLDDVRRLEPGLNRDYIPRHKKVGSVSHYSIAEDAPALLAFYRSERLRRFHGDTVCHGVGPSRGRERRVVFTMEYVTSREMGRAQRLFSNLKDAFAYFGVRALWRGRGRGARATA